MGTSVIEMNEWMDGCHVDKGMRKTAGSTQGPSGGACVSMRSGGKEGGMCLKALALRLPPEGRLRSLPVFLAHEYLIGSRFFRAGRPQAT